MLLTIGQEKIENEINRYDEINSYDDNAITEQDTFLEKVKKYFKTMESFSGSNVAILYEINFEKNEITMLYSV